MQQGDPDHKDDNLDNFNLALDSSPRYATNHLEYLGYATKSQATHYSG